MPLLPALVAPTLTRESGPAPRRRPGSLWTQLRELDARRPGVPGEHWFAFGSGAALLWRSRRLAHPALKALAGAGGALLIARGLSGRDGFLAWLRQRQPR